MTTDTLVGLTIAVGAAALTWLCYELVSIELNPDYVAMARRRIESDAPMVSEPVEVMAGGEQLGLFEGSA